MTQVATGEISTQTSGGRLMADPAVHAAVDTIVDRVRAASAEITDAKPADPALAEPFDALKARAAAVKGRGLLYPYIGSGSGNGALVELADGSVKWDMITGIGVHFFGHSHPELVRASVMGSLEDTTKHGNLQTGFGAYEFGEKLVKLAGRTSRLKHAFITTSGAMANESAIKVCYQKHAPASRVIAFQDCFMGRSVTMCQIGDSAGGRQGVPLSTQVDYMPFYNEAAAERMGGPNRYIDMCLMHLDQYIARYPKQHACFIFELVQGEGGFNTAPRDFFVQLMERCKAANIAVWDDEIQSFGRTPQMFAFEQYELGSYVDVFCVGKMSQACATLYTEEYNPKAGLLSGTFTGASQDLYAGNAVLDMLTASDLYDSKPGAGDGLISKHHAAFREQVEALAAKHPEWFPKNPGVPRHADGIGGMMRFTPFGGKKDKIAAAAKAMYEEGVIVFWCGHDPFHLRMLPPLGVMKLEDWPRVFESVERGLAKVG